MSHSPDADASGTAPAVHDLGYARLDLDRAERTGDPEVVYGAGKSPAQVVEILTRLHERHPHRAVLATRLTDAAIDAVRLALPDTVVDLVAREAALTVAVFGAATRLITDVGVAGLHRVMGVRAELAAADCLVVVAGMEGALPSVVGGLTGVPLVAVPTSVGYGASFGGVAALLAMLNSCAPGVTVVNIDNGFGAGVFAARVARNAAPRPPA